MKKIGIIYGSSTGTCQNIAEIIAEKLGVSKKDVIDAGKIKKEQVEQYEVLLLGTSTWGDGELQDDWYDGIKELKAAKLKGMIIALFGCGDSESYCDTFCDAIGDLYEDLQSEGCIFIGQVSADQYSFSSSKAVIDNQFVGLALDEINEDDKTNARIDAWISDLKKHLE